MVEFKEQEANIVVRLSKKLKNILESVLATGDWSSSLFLKTSAKKLQDLKEQTEKLHQINSDGKPDAASHQDSDKSNIPAGYSQIYILLYQVDGNNVQTWYRTIKNLVEYSVTRPAYNDENHAREFIRSKAPNVERHGYVIANVKNEEFYPVEQQLDIFGHQLFALKEGSVKLENIIQFIHANKRRYVVRDDAVVFVGEI